MKASTWITAVIAFSLAAQLAYGQSSEADRIIGEWIPGHGNARVKITKENDVFTGTIVWLREPVDQKSGEPRKNINSRDPEMRDKPLMGLKIVDGFQFTDKRVWESGTVYDPESGRTYCGKITLLNDNELRLRGSICGLSLLGRNDTWTRYSNADK